MHDRPLRPPHPGVLGLVFVWLTLILVVPLLALVARVLAEPGAALTALWMPEALRALGLSLAMAAASLAISGALGLASAIVLVRHRFFGRAALDALVEMPLAISPVMTGLAFLLVFGRVGWLGGTLDALGFKVAFAWPGVLLATLFVTLPFVIREVGLVLEEVGEDEEHAAATLGASAWQTFWRVTLPNVRSGLGAGAVLTVARALGEFGAVLVLGGAIAGRTSTATTFVHTAIEERQIAGAYGMATLLAAATAALLWVLQRTERS